MFEKGCIFFIPIKILISLVNKMNNLVVQSVNKDNLKDIQTINSIVLPVTYSYQTYNQILQNGANFSFIGKNSKFTIVYTKNGEPIGAIGCGIEEYKENKRKLFIMTLAVLSSYRQKGIGK